MPGNVIGGSKFGAGVNVRKSRSSYQKFNKFHKNQPASLQSKQSDYLAQMGSTSNSTSHNIESPNYMNPNFSFADKDGSTGQLVPTQINEPLGDSSTSEQSKVNILREKYLRKPPKDESNLNSLKNKLLAIPNWVSLPYMEQSISNENENENENENNAYVLQEGANMSPSSSK